MAREALKKIVVFGGNGFVGSEVLKRLSTVPTVHAVSVSRRGAAPSHCAAFADKVEWLKGDCLDKKTYSDALAGAAAVVVSVGSPPIPGDVEAARKANGATNVAVLEAAMDAKVKRAVVVGATMPPWLDKIAEGYVQGKRDAFEALGGFALSGGAVVVKPSAIYGTRHTESGYPIPLAPVMAPLSYALRIGRPVTGFVTGLAPSLLDGLLEPPVPVQAVAQTVVDACLEDEYEEGFVALGVEEILRRC